MVQVERRRAGEKSTVANAIDRQRSTEVTKPEKQWAERRPLTKAISTSTGLVQEVLQDQENNLMNFKIPSNAKDDER